MAVTKTASTVTYALKAMPISDPYDKTTGVALYDSATGNIVRRWCNKNGEIVPDLPPDEIARLTKLMRNHVNLDFTEHGGGAGRLLSYPAPSAQEYCPEEVDLAEALLRAQCVHVPLFELISMHRRFIEYYSPNKPHETFHETYLNSLEPTKRARRPNRMPGTVNYVGWAWDVVCKLDGKMLAQDHGPSRFAVALKPDIIASYSKYRPELAHSVAERLPDNQFILVGHEICEAPGGKGYEDGHYPTPYSRPITLDMWLLGRWIPRLIKENCFSTGKVFKSQEGVRINQAQANRVNKILADRYRKH